MLCIQHLKVFNWSSKRRNRTRCPTPSGHERTGSSSSRWSTTRPWWAPESISSARVQKASSTERSTGPLRRAAKRKAASRSRARRPKAPPPTTEDWTSHCGEGDPPPPASLNGCWPDIDDSIICFGVAEKHMCFS